MVSLIGFGEEQPNNDKKLANATIILNIFLLLSSKFYLLYLIPSFLAISLGSASLWTTMFKVL